MAGSWPAGSWQALTVIAGIGIDIVDIARLDAALLRTPGLAARLFTAAEREAAAVRSAPVASLAGCFAAKEALAKALGAPAGLRWTDAEVVRERAGRPRMRVSGTVAAEASRQRVGAWHVSLSHDGGLCVAVVVAERAERSEPGGSAGGQDALGMRSCKGGKVGERGEG